MYQRRVPSSPTYPGLEMSWGKKDGKGGEKDDEEDAPEGLVRTNLSQP